MFDHVTIRVADRGASERFYRTVLRTLGLDDPYSDERLAEWKDFSLAPAEGDAAVTRGLHIGFTAQSRAQVEDFWRAGTVAGYRDDGAPGPREQYSQSYYGGFLLDPDGNSAEAVHHGAMRDRGMIDHLWIRVADVAASKRFYELVGAHAGFELHRDTAGRAHFAGSTGSFSLVLGKPAQNVHVAFGVPDDATVAAFHRAAVAAGYRDNGEPGERPAYHPGYYAAYVLDPGGNNVELVNHGR